ncbi:ArsR family transcriptional regulator, partial [Streptomyces katrae]
AHLRLTDEQFAELGARLKALADEYRALSDPSLPDASLVFALFHPGSHAQAEGDVK